MTKQGDRVAAIMSADQKEIRWLGEGVYEGEFVPGPEVAGFMADMLRRMGRPNPRIKLDSGQTVYGCECWWGPVEQVRKKFQGMKMVLVDIDEARRACEDTKEEKPSA
jgi:hypothetical protein